MTLIVSHIGLANNIYSTTIKGRGGRGLTVSVRRESWNSENSKGGGGSLTFTSRDVLSGELLNTSTATGQVLTD